MLLYNLLLISKIISEKPSKGEDANGEYTKAKGTTQSATPTKN